MPEWLKQLVIVAPGFVLAGGLWIYLDQAKYAAIAAQQSACAAQLTTQRKDYEASRQRTEAFLIHLSDLVRALTVSLTVSQLGNTAEDRVEVRELLMEVQAILRAQREEAVVQGAR